MKITLELFDDQSDYDPDDIETSQWIMKADGAEIVRHSIVTLDVAHKAVGKIIDIEEMINNGLQ